MISAADEVSIDFSTSCNRDVAVAKLLGWMQGPIRKRYIQVMENGIPLKEMPYLHRFDGRLKEFLLEMREFAQQKLFDALNVYEELDSNEARLSVNDADDDMEQINQKINLAAEYFCAIDDELAKGVNSELRIDKIATVDSTDPYITLKSLDAWAKSRGYPLQVLDTFQEYSVPPATEAVEAEEPLLNAKGGMSATAARSFLVTFAILLEQFIERAGPQFKSEGGAGINMEEVAKLLCKHSLPGARKDNFLKSQSISSIEARMKVVLSASSDAILVQRQKERKTAK